MAGVWLMALICWYVRRCQFGSTASENLQDGFLHGVSEAFHTEHVQSEARGLPAPTPTRVIPLSVLLMPGIS